MILALRVALNKKNAEISSLRADNHHVGGVLSNMKIRVTKVKNEIVEKQEITPMPLLHAIVEQKWKNKY